MSYAVPNQDLDDDVSVPARSTSNSGDVPLFGYEIEELTWENGELIGSGSGSWPGHQSNVNPYTYTAAKEKPRAAIGTLESVVDLATRLPAGTGSVGNDVPRRDTRPSGSASIDMDVLVPNGEERIVLPPRTSTWDVGGSTRVVQEEGFVLKKARLRATRVPAVTGSQSGGSYSGYVDMSEDDSGGVGRSTASLCTKGTPTQDEKKETKRSPLSTKRSRADSHNQSERKRRQIINHKMKTLQKMVPNSSKTNKASMLDEVMNYIKQLQAQVHMMTMSKVGIPSMSTMPYVMPQHPLQMSMISPMGMNMGMGLNMKVNMSNINSAIMAHQNLADLSQIMPTAPWNVATETPPSSSTTGPSAHCQPQPMTMEAYNMMVALMQQHRASATSKN